MLHPQLLSVFATIIRTGSISAAAAELRCGKSLVSRQLARLEQDLGARLVQRSTRRLALTEIGEMVLVQARQVAQALANIEELADVQQQQVRGPLRVSCALAHRRFMVPLVVEFAQRYPQIRILLQFEDHLADLIGEQLDVAIRTAWLADSKLVARKLSDNPRITVAAPSYLARAGTPRTPADLLGHACVIYASRTRVFNDWGFIGPEGTCSVRVDGPVQINDGGAMVTAAVAGAGILRIARPLVDDELASGALVPVLAGYALAPGVPTFAVVAAREFLPHKIRTFVDFLQERLGS